MELLLLIPAILAAILLIQGISLRKSQQRLTAAYKQAYEDAQARAEANGKQVEAALGAAKSWEAAFNKMEQVNARNENTIKSLLAGMRGTPESAGGSK